MLSTHVVSFTTLADVAPAARSTWPMFS